MTKKHSVAQKVAVFSALCMATFFLSGCLAFLLGGAAVYEASPDSAKTVFDASYDRSYNASFEVAKTMVGIFDTDDKASGWIKLTSDNNNIAIHVVKLTEKATQVTVSARKYSAPKAGLARDILAKISKKLR